MDSPNKSRLRIAAVVSVAALAGLIGSTGASALGGSGATVIEGSGAHPTVVVPADAWQSKCDFFVAKAAEAQKAAELKAEKFAANAAADKAEKAKAKAEKLAELKAAKAAKEAAGEDPMKDPAHKHGKHHHQWHWDNTGKSERDGTGCAGHDNDDSGGSDGTDK